MTDEQLGLLVVSFFKGAGDFCKAFWYGVGEIFLKKESFGNKGYGKIIGFFIFLILGCGVFLYANRLIVYLPESLGRFRSPVALKGVSVFMVILYVKMEGDEKLKFLNSFHQKFECIGLYSRLTKEIYDEKGKKIKVKDTPKLLKMFENKEDITYIFGSSGITLTEWQKKILDLEAVFNTNIVEVDYVKDSKSAVKIKTVSNEVKARLDEEREEIEKYDVVFEKVGLYSKGTKDVIKNGRLEKRKDYPEFVKDKQDGRKEIFFFKSDGVAIADWKAKKDQLESAFDTNVLRIQHDTNSKQIVKMVTVPTKYNIKTSYPWQQELIPKEDFEVVLGEGLLEKAKLNFNGTPHVLIGGLTNSGKSVLLRSIVWQVIKKGAKVFLVDFKGAIELGAFEDFGEVVFERRRVLQILDSLVKEHRARLDIFKQVKTKKSKNKIKDIKNIVDYNKVVPEHQKLTRVFLIVDEIAELMDTTGVSKEELPIYTAIESKLNTLARLSRATGINMILATQRPDAKVIKGQIKNNLGARISGRMTDKEPSIMVLGSPEATKLPEDVKGRFLFSLGAEPVEFQGYYFKDEDIIEGNYEEGIMLVADNQRVEIRENKIKVDISKDQENKVQQSQEKQKDREEDENQNNQEEDKDQNNQEKYDPNWLKDALGNTDVNDEDHEWTEDDLFGLPEFVREEDMVNHEEDEDEYEEVEEEIEENSFESEDQVDEQTEDSKQQECKQTDKELAEKEVKDKENSRRRNKVKISI